MTYTQTILLDRGGGRPRTPLVDRWMDKVLVGDGCWSWLGANNGRYGSTNLPNGTKQPTRLGAHRAAWMIFRGSLDERPIDHLCKNTMCVRPSHLELVTVRENLSRSNAPGWVQHHTGVCKRGHQQTGENVGVRPNGKRWCRPCAKTWRRSS